MLNWPDEPEFEELTQTVSGTTRRVRAEITGRLETRRNEDSQRIPILQVRAARILIAEDLTPDAYTDYLSTFRRE